jgi:hypothetical protein
MESAAAAAGVLRRETRVAASMAFTAAIMLWLDPSLAWDVSLT